MKNKNITLYIKKIEWRFVQFGVFIGLMIITVTLIHLYSTYLIQVNSKLDNINLINPGFLTGSFVIILVFIVTLLNFSSFLYYTEYHDEDNKKKTMTIKRQINKQRDKILIKEDLKISSKASSTSLSSSKSRHRSVINDSLVKTKSPKIKKKNNNNKQICIERNKTDERMRSESLQQHPFKIIKNHRKQRPPETNKEKNLRRTSFQYENNKIISNDTIHNGDFNKPPKIIDSRVESVKVIPRMSPRFSSISIRTTSPMISDVSLNSRNLSEIPLKDGLTWTPSKKNRVQFKENPQIIIDEAQEKEIVINRQKLLNNYEDSSTESLVPSPRNTRIGLMAISLSPPPNVPDPILPPRQLRAYPLASSPEETDDES